MPQKPFSNLDEVYEVFEAMSRVREPSSYLDADRARDFMAVFNGESTAVQGLRVLSHISNHCNPYPREGLSADQRSFNDGRRSVLHWINRCMTVRGDVKVENRPPDEPGDD